MIFKLLQAKGSVESVVAINLRSIFWCKITLARGMSLTGWSVISLKKLMLSPMATEHSETFYRAQARI